MLLYCWTLGQTRAASFWLSQRTSALKETDANKLASDDGGNFYEQIGQLVVEHGSQPGVPELSELFCASDKPPT